VRAALLAIGSELVHAGRADTNGDWLRERFLRAGMPVAMRVSVEDDEDAIAAALAAATAACEIVVLTGGLGPTDDDRTRAAVARALDAPLERDERVVDEIRRRFESRGRRFSAHQARQADRPCGAVWLPNPLGTAPGFRVERGSTTVFALPGVPAEMRAMYEHGVAPFLRALGPGALARRTFKIGGRLESSVDRQIHDLYAWPGVTVTILAGIPGIELHVGIAGRDADDARAGLERVEREIRARLGEDLYGVDDDTLEEVVGRGLLAARRTVATAESCTAGAIGAALTAVPGSSAWFRGGLIVYDDALKIGLAGVDPATLARHGAVSGEVAVELADGARRRCGSDVGIGVTGIAGPGGGSADKPVGLVHLAIADPDGVHAEAFRFPGDRAAVRGRTVAWALERLRRRLPER